MVEQFPEDQGKPGASLFETRIELRAAIEKGKLNSVLDSPEQRLPLEEIWRLYERYINHRHADGDMYPANREQFDSFLVAGRPEARFTEYRLGEQLIAVAVSDELDDGLSAIYTFFDPDYADRSLGTYAILDLLHQTQLKALSHLYLGYWIQASDKMRYKAEFLPQERLSQAGWTLTT